MEKVYELVGGRIIHLKIIADAILEGERLNGILYTFIYYIIQGGFGAARGARRIRIQILQEK
jgi:hypothetical protein